MDDESHSKAESIEPLESYGTVEGRIQTLSGNRRLRYVNVWSWVCQAHSRLIECTRTPIANMSSRGSGVLESIIAKALADGARVTCVLSGGQIQASVPNSTTSIAPIVAPLKAEEEIEAEWDDTPLFAADEPDVIRANMTPVSDEWLTRAYRAVFPRAE